MPKAEQAKAQERTGEKAEKTGEKNPASRMDNGRDAKGRFTKGNSGNPTGRPTMPTDVKQRLISLLPKAIDTIQSMIEDEHCKPEVRIKAAEMIVERNLGKAVTPVLTETVGEGSTLTLAEMIACAKDLLNAE